jgi:hypothetical protein
MQHIATNKAGPNHRLKERRAKVCARFSQNVGPSKAKSKNQFGVTRLQSSSLTAASKNKKRSISEMNQSQCFPGVIQRRPTHTGFRTGTLSLSSSLMQHIVTNKAGSQQSAQRATRKSLRAL